LSDDECIKLRAYIVDLAESPNWKNVRNAAAMALALGAGLRSSELIQLERDDVLEGKQPAIRIRAHPPVTERTPTFTETGLFPVVEHWLDLRARLPIPGKLALPGALSGKPLVPSTLYRAIERAGLQLFGRAASPMMLRNTFGRLAAERYSVGQAQIWMGHVHVKATLRVAQPTK
jgi:integrase